MKIALVVQRFGQEILGGAELHCRFIAEHLAQAHEVDLLTTCARDYLTWQNFYEPGQSSWQTLKIVRFPVVKQRDQVRYDQLSYLVSFCAHTPAHEKEWLVEQGPHCPALIDYIDRQSSVYDAFIFFSYRYATVYQGLGLVKSKSILVPTAENDRIIHLSLYRDFFHLPAAIAYNSIEEREMIQSITGNQSVFGNVVGVGLSEVEPVLSSELMRKFDLRRPYLVYVGRLEEVKGCARLADYYLRYIEHNKPWFDLVYLGSGTYRPPVQANILHIQDAIEAEKMAVIKGAQALVIPSPFESLSMVVLEAWSVKRPVIANGDCPVLRGQCLRSNGGLYYRNYDEFEAVLNAIENDHHLTTRLGEQGHDYYREHYNWPTIMSKYEQLLGACRCP
ncbi:glycosyltransferase family 4 protein [bacterium]|nr:glycosyltransferase family 4 protein [bacterium]